LTAQQMCQKGHDVVFIYPESKLNFVMENVGVEDQNCTMKVIGTLGILPMRFRTGGFAFLDCLFKTMYVLTHRVDVIQVTNGHRPAQLIPCLIGKYVKKAIIVDECWEWLGKGGYADIRKGFIGKIISFYDSFFELRFKRFFDEIITISNTLKNRFKNKQNITVLHGGTENKKLKAYDIRIVRNELGLSNKAFIIGMSNVCTGDHEDNIIFFKAFEKLSQEYDELFLVLTGSEKEHINEIKKSYTFTNRIIFPGWVDFELYNKYLSACNIFILPLRNNPINAGRWPNKIGDYFCLNRPVITNPTGDMKEFLRKYKVGFVCNETSDDFYNLFKKILSEKLDLSHFHKDSLYVANEILSFDKRIDKFIEIFKAHLKMSNHHHE